MKFALTLSIIITCAALGFALFQTQQLAGVQARLKSAESERESALKSSTDYSRKLKQAEQDLAGKDAMLKQTREQALAAVERVGSAARESIETQKAEIISLKGKLARTQITP